MKISVIITVFNGEKYLANAIDSFIKQDYLDKELIIVDGISVDKSHEIIDDYQKKFPEVIKWIREKDKGISHARNIGLKHVTGDIVGFLGCDDFLHKDFFSNMKYYLEVNPSFDVIYFNNYSIGLINDFSNSATKSVNVRNLIRYSPIASGESFYYKKKIFDVFQFNEKNRYCMDYELNFHIASSKKFDGSKYCFFPVNITSVFNQNTGVNHSTANSIKQRLETIVVQLKYTDSNIGKFRILYKGKKIILKNFSLFKQIKNNFK